MFAPTGIGVLYGREALLEQMSPWQGGGDMIKTVSFEHTEYNELPYKFEAGTPNIEGMIAMGAAVRFLEGLDLEAAYAHEHALLEQVSAELHDLPGRKVVGEAAHKTGVYSFTIDGVHPHDLGVLLDGMGIAIRTGHHCAMPVMSRYGLSGTARASFALYNTAEDAAAFIAGVRRAADMLV
jgi:cysteine desulfurase/selenocysteine lyase